MEQKKRRKLCHFTNLMALGIEVTDERSVKNKKTGEKGICFQLYKLLTTEQELALSKYDNVIIRNGYYRYAPEIKVQSIVLLGER